MASLRPEQLPAHLGKTLAPAYLLHGDEPLLALESADAIRAAARSKGYSERKVLTVDRHFKWAELAAAGSSMSLFGDRTLVELRIPSGKPGSEGSEAISRFCAQLPSDVLLMTSLPRLGKREQSSAWFSALAGVGSTVEIYPVERAALPRWMAERLARQNQKANAETLAFLTDCVEGNLLAAHQEIRKLGLLLPEGELPFEAVREAVLNVARFDAGKLSEAMLGGDRARLARMLDGLRAEGEATPRIVWLMAEEIRAVARVQEGLASGRSVSDLCREHRIWGEPRQTLVGRAAQQIGRAHV